MTFKDIVAGNGWTAALGIDNNIYTAGLDSTYGFLGFNNTANVRTFPALPVTKTEGDIGPANGFAQLGAGVNHVFAISGQFSFLPSSNLRLTFQLSSESKCCVGMGS